MGIPSFGNVLSFGSSTLLPALRSRSGAEAEAALLDAEAERKEREAEDAAVMGRLDQAERIRKGRREIAGLRVRYAAAGVRADSGSALAAAADRAAWGEYERQRAELGADMESWGLRYDAALLRAEAAGARMRSV